MRVKADTHKALHLERVGADTRAGAGAGSDGVPAASGVVGAIGRSTSERGAIELARSQGTSRALCEV